MPRPAGLGGAGKVLMNQQQTHARKLMGDRRTRGWQMRRRAVGAPKQFARFRPDVGSMESRRAERVTCEPSGPARATSAYCEAMTRTSSCAQLSRTTDFFSLRNLTFE